MKINKETFSINETHIMFDDIDGVTHVIPFHTCSLKRVTIDAENDLYKYYIYTVYSMFEINSVMFTELVEYMFKQF